jgi:8-oxo-dGTP diphosphatase
MPVTASYCVKCAGRLETRVIDGSSRQVCADCATIFYRNPLPVAAAVVLNEQREVLLVKRLNPPHQDEWCLPTGFAELDETIEEASLRELVEETGIQGRILRLLSASSTQSSFYGDLLFVCFEVEKLGGRIKPGDDALDLAFFPIDAIPPLAFKPHEKAIRVARELHGEDWAVEDSFARLQDNRIEEGLLSDALVRSVRDNAELISSHWLQAVRTSPSTASYARTPPEEIIPRAIDALSSFCSWLSRTAPSDEMIAFYRALGRERRELGFELPEVISALTLLRFEIWTFARREHLLGGPLEMYRVMELSRRVVRFFDKAIYHTSRGYLGED